MTHSFLPLFDALAYIGNTSNASKHPSYVNEDDYKHSLNFLKAYRGSEGTFNSYRREVERLLQWCSLIAHKTLAELRREDIEAFIHFCQNPPLSWIGIKKAPRFLSEAENRMPNPEWRPFVATVSKSAHQKGDRPDPKKFELSQGAIKEIFAILSTFFNYLLQEEHVFMNPVALIRQKSKFIRKHQGQPVVRRLTDLQWKYVLKTASTMADLEPELHERTLFIMSALYGMYLRISELSSSTRWSPQMNHFLRDGDGNWWFMTVGKGNKQRQIAVSNAMLDALKRWRQSLGLSALPSSSDQSPLLPKAKGKGPITSTTYLRTCVQSCFDQAALDLEKNNLSEEADSLRDVTVHWLRHTGISDDVKIRPREHVRDDAGHSSSATTDKYIDIELKERHRSAKDKTI
ncbi:MAG: tyrosine-type recombinase/integrase [Proteobacteria bacterium]|nr:tyrosine-type recombinase/integrase [Pseudomonadota bacterium]